MNRNLEINVKEAKQFIITLCGDTAPTFQTFDDDKDRSAENKKKLGYDPYAKVFHGNLDIHNNALIQLQKDRAGCFIMVNEGDGIIHDALPGQKKPTTCRNAHNVVRVRAAFVDLDGAPLEPIVQSLKPHIIVESSPGRYHAYWKMSDCPIDKFTSIQKAIINKFNGDRSVHDIPRVMRVPGFIHQKGEAFETRIIETNNIPPYTLDELVTGLQLQLNNQNVQPSNEESNDDPFQGNSEGGRTKCIERIAGTLFHRKFSIEEAVDFCETLDATKNSPPLESTHPGKVRETVEGIYRRYYSNIFDVAPIPLSRKIASPDDYPIDAFPSVIRNAAAKMIEVIQAPSSLIGQSLLAAVTLAVQPHADVMIDGRVSPTSNNFLTIGESGIRKSGTDRNANHVIRERQKNNHCAAAFGRIELEAMQAAWDVTHKKIVNDKKMSHDEIRLELMNLGERPIVPSILEYTEEPTYEGLVRSYATGNLSLGLFSDEGGRFLGGFAMNQENATKTITGLSKLWDGDCITRTRGGEGNTLIYGVRLSLHLMIQPVLADRVFSDPMLSGQGFMSRCLCCHPESNIGNRPYREVDLSNDPTMDAYHRSMQIIAGVPYPIGESGSGLNPRRLVFSSAAKRTWIQFHDHIENLQKDGADLARIRGFASKSAEHAARIAAVLAFFNGVSDGIDVSEIGNEPLDAAIELAQFYISEALRLFDTAQTSPDLILADKALQWAATNSHHPGLLPMVNLYQSGPGAIRSKAIAERIIRVLEEHQQIERVENGCDICGTHRRDVWRVRS